MIYLHVCVVWLQKRPQQSAPSLAAAPASLHQVANMQEAGGSRSFQLCSQSRRSVMFRQGCLRVMDKTCWKASPSVPARAGVVAVFVRQILYSAYGNMSAFCWQKSLILCQDFLETAFGYFLVSLH